MTLKPPAVFIELEELASALPSRDEDANIESEDIISDISDIIDVRILNPSSKWNVLINISVLAYKSTQALKKCGHSLQMLTYNATDVSFSCHLCNFGEFEKEVVVDISNNEAIENIFCSGNDRNETFQKRNEIASISNVRSQGTRFEARQDVNDKLEPSVEVVNSDLDVSNNCDGENVVAESLLVESPIITKNETENYGEVGEETLMKETGPVLLFDTRFDKLDTKTENHEDDLPDLALDLLYPDIKLKEDLVENTDSNSKILNKDSFKEVSVLKIRPLSELQNQMSDLPSYKSNQVSDGLNPMTNIPTYVIDNSIIDVEQDNLKDDLQPIPLDYQVQTPTTANFRVQNVKKFISPQLSRPLHFQQGQMVSPIESPKMYHPQQNYILNSFPQSSSPSVPISSPRPQINNLRAPHLQSVIHSSPNLTSYQTSPSRSQQQQYQKSPQSFLGGGYAAQNHYPHNVQTYQKMNTPTRSSPNLSRVQGGPSAQIGGPVQRQLKLSAQNQMSIDNLVMQKSQLYQDQNQFVSQNFSPQNQILAQNQSLYNRIQQFQSNSSQPYQQGFGENHHQANLPMASPSQIPPRVQNHNLSLQALNSGSLSVNVVRGTPKEVPQATRPSASPDGHRNPLPLYHDPRLPPGWKRSVFRTEQGQYAVILQDHQGRKFRSKEEVRKYLEGKKVADVDPEKIDFSVFGKV